MFGSFRGEETFRLMFGLFIGEDILQLMYGSFLGEFSPDYDFISTNYVILLEFDWIPVILH